ncbi:MAG: rod shape-determining protein RodA [Bdellovibrionota bacterium]|nr:MAG: rod shape-determining protein RodA [Bdellovibrionota bacterium]
MEKRILRTFDWPLLLTGLLIPLLGLGVLYSAGYNPDNNLRMLFGLIDSPASPAFSKQATFLLLSLVVMAFAMALPPTFLHRVSYVLYGGGVILLILVLLFGTVVNGSRRWLDLGAFNLQPAELMKIGAIMALARYISKYPPSNDGYSFTQVLLPLSIVLVPMALIMRQPDLGTALVIGGVGALMILFVGVELKVLVSGVVLAVAAAVPAWMFLLHDYQRRRVLTLFDPAADPQGSGYHILQSIIAVGSGSFAGKGYLQGTQSQLAFLPEHTTDFIFSVLAEEWGFIGCASVLILYAFLLYRILRVAAKSKDLYSSMMVTGIASLLFVHAVVNVGMVIGLLPVVGIPLKLFSYGGSSLVSTFFCLGLVLGVSMRRFQYLRGAR